MLRPTGAPDEPDNGRVLMMVDSVDEAEAVSSDLRRRGVSAEVRVAAVGAAPTLRLCHR